MARYRLYHLQGHRLAAADEIEAADDAEAASLARERARFDVTEVWRGDRRVRTILPPAASRA
jgi:hypothetical protein